jgi:hypothetical protein
MITIDTPRARVKAHRAQRRATTKARRRPDSAVAKRQRDFRARRSAGRRVDPVEYQEVDVLEALKIAGYLRADQEDNRRAVRAALGRLIASSAAAILRGA